MRRAGLKKITKLVKSKKGSVRRSYWVKSNDLTHQRTKSVLLYKAGLGNLGGSFGMSSGMKLGARSDKHNWVRGGLYGGIAGSTIGHFAGIGIADVTHKHISTKNLQRATVAAHTLAIANSVHHAYRILKGIRNAPRTPSFGLVN